MSFIRRVFGVEWRHIFVLPEKARTLLASFSLSAIAEPLLGLFINAFLWRAHQSALLIAAYNIGMFFGVTLGYVLAGALLERRFNIGYLYAAGTCGMGVVVGAIVFFAPTSLAAILASGILFGLAAGVYWGNRHFLTLEYTEDRTNNYFFGLAAAIASITGVVVPAAAGWFIIAGPASELYETGTAYRILMFAALAILFMAGRAIYKKNFSVPRIKALFVGKADKFWNGVRGTALISGLFSGVNHFVPVIMVLVFVGAEGALGSIKSMVTLGTAVVLYFIGRLAPPGARAAVMGWGAAVVLTAAAIFAVWGSPAAALLYVVASGFGAAIINASYAPFETFAKEVDTGEDHSLRYSRVMDHEIFLNSGRVIAIAVFMVIIAYLPLVESMRIILPAVAVLQIGLVLLVRALVRMADMPPGDSGHRGDSGRLGRMGGLAAGGRIPAGRARKSSMQRG